MHVGLAGMSPISHLEGAHVGITSTSSGGLRILLQLRNRHSEFPAVQSQIKGPRSGGDERPGATI